MPIEDLGEFIEKIEKVKETDFPLSGESLYHVFKGKREKIKSISDKIIEELKKNHPEYFEKRKSHKSIVESIIFPEGKKEFINAMFKAGLKLKKKHEE